MKNLKPYTYQWSTYIRTSHYKRWLNPANQYKYRILILPPSDLIPPV
ncbi:hypothetical protein [cyanobacterium endosymbiont of Rhopalodia gibberula]|nr:hypothetical protein [cyanobacterium endosymbiont of Rhopalodia gibberula]